MKKLIFTLLVILCSYQSIFATYSLHNLDNLNNQISNNAILCMHQDAYGFMWFGTYDGLNLFDGKKVTVFRYESDNPNSLSGNTIHNIQRFGSDYLWIVTQAGLDKFSIKERRVVESYAEYKRADFLATDSKKNSWLIVRNNYILFYDSIQKKFNEISFKGLKMGDIRSFFTDKEDRLCIVKREGALQVVTLNNPDGNPANYSLSVQKKYFHNKLINQVFYEDGLIYFIDEDLNLFLYDNFKQQKILLRNISDVIKQYGLISSLTFFRQEIFIAFMHSGLVKLNVSGPAKPEPINLSYGVFGLQKDRYQDALWVGTDGQGVELYYSEKDRFRNILLKNFPFTAKRPVRSMYTDELNTLWVGTKGDGIMRIKDYARLGDGKIPAQNIQRFISQAGLSGNPVYSFIRSAYNKNDLWIGTDAGIIYYSYRENKIFQLKDSNTKGKLLSNVHSFCEVNDSTLWVSSKGLYKVIVDKSRKPYEIKSKTRFIYHNELLDDDEGYYSMVYDGKSKLLLGSRRGYGVLQIDIPSWKYDFISMQNAEKKGLGDIIYLHRENDSEIYIGAGSGLTRIKMMKGPENQIKQFGRNNGIINDMIHGILKDNNGIIWLSTNKGLVKYNPENESFFNVKSSQIGVTEFSDDACWHCPITDRLFFGGVTGLVWVEPRNDENDVIFKPNLLFTELECQGKETTLYEYNGKEKVVLKLPANQNTFQISFAVLDYIHGENYDFSYMLENYTNGWVSLRKESKINFTKLPPGDYVLKVKYKNDVLHEDDNIYSLHIKILPPWYLSTIAYIIYLILTVLLARYSIFYIQRNFKKKQALIAQKIKEEQKERMYESKLRFFTNVTHELYTPLTLINGGLEQIKKEGGSERLKKYIAILQNNVLSLNELIQEILDYRKIEESDKAPYALNNVSVSAMMSSLMNSFSEIAQQNDVKLITSIPENIDWYTDRASFKKIVSNLISNAFKYTPVGGVVKVSVCVEDDSLKISVYNTGRGIEQDKIKTIFNRYSILENTDVNANNQMTARNGLGLFICHSMTKLLQGQIEVESTLNEYAQFTVILPNLTKEKVKLNVKVAEDKPEPVMPSALLHEKQEKKEELRMAPLERATNLILVIDDNQEIVEMVSDILAPDYVVLKAYGAAEALNILKNQTPSLIITDIMMPEIDGLSFIQMVRNNKYNKHIPIIALSAGVEKQDQVKGYEAGADAYMTKPFSSEILLSVVNRFLVNKEEIKSYYDTVESAFEYNYGKLMHAKDKEFLEQVTTIIRENISNTDLGPDFIADKMKMSSRNLYRQLKTILSVSSSDFIKDYKLSYASKLLKTTNLSIKEIIFKVGISNKSYFYREFAKKYNVSPKQYKESYKSDPGLSKDDLTGT